MTTNDYLAIAVTAIGGVLCFVFMLFLFLGTKIPGDDSKPQVVKFKGLELQTNTIIMILLISAIVTIIPFGLTTYLPYSPKTTPYEVWHITGQVTMEGNEPLLQSDITINPPNVNVSKGGTFDLDVPVVKKQGSILKFPTVSIGHPGFTTVDIHLGNSPATSLGSLAIKVEKDVKSKSITIEPVTLQLAAPYQGEKR